MAKLKLQAEPTFTVPVKIPIAGAEPVTVKMTFKHRTKAELDAWAEQAKGKENADYLMDMVVGWDGFEEPCTKENMEILIQNRMGATAAIIDAYFAQLYPAKLGN